MGGIEGEDWEGESTETHKKNQSRGRRGMGKEGGSLECMKDTKKYNIYQVTLIRSYSHWNWVLRGHILLGVREE